MKALKRLARWSPSALVVGGIFAVLTTSAAAHHGWAWGDPEQTELTGVIMDISMRFPHPELTVEAEGRTWLVELDDVRQTRGSGLEMALGVGKAIVALGHRNSNHSTAHFKAVRVTVEGAPYDVYPDRIIRD